MKKKYGGIILFSLKTTKLAMQGTSLQEIVFIPLHIRSLYFCVFMQRYHCLRGYPTQKLLCKVFAMVLLTFLSVSTVRRVKCFRSF